MENENVVNIDQPETGLAMQFVIGAMLSQGITELRISKEMFEQATTKLFMVEQLEDGTLVIQLRR